MFPPVAWARRCEKETAAELRCDVAAHALGGRVGVEQLGVERFEILQFAQKHVEAVVFDLRRIFDIILVIVVIEFGSQLVYPLLVVDCIHTGFRVSEYIGKGT